MPLTESCLFCQHEKDPYREAPECISGRFSVEFVSVECEQMDFHTFSPSSWTCQGFQYINGTCTTLWMMRMIVNVCELVGHVSCLSDTSPTYFLQPSYSSLRTNSQFIQISKAFVYITFFLGGIGINEDFLCHFHFCVASNLKDSWSPFPHFRKLNGKIKSSIIIIIDTAVCHETSRRWNIWK